MEKHSKLETDKLAYEKLTAFFIKKYDMGTPLTHSDIYEFLTDNVLDNLGRDIIDKFHKYENENKSDEYMELLVNNKAKLDAISVNFLYHRWLRIHVLSLYDSKERKEIENIPIIYNPHEYYLNAYIMPALKGPVIGFSYGFDCILLNQWRPVKLCRK